MDINESVDSPTRRRSLPHSTTHATWDSISWEQQRGRLVTKVQRRKALLPYLPPTRQGAIKRSLGEGPAPKPPQPRRGSRAIAYAVWDLIPLSARISTILGPGIQHFVVMRRHTMLYLTCRFRSRAWKVLSPPRLHGPLCDSPLPALTTTRSAGCIRIIANEMRLFCSLHS